MAQEKPLELNPNDGEKSESTIETNSLAADIIDLANASSTILPSEIPATIPEVALPKITIDPGPIIPDYNGTTQQLIDLCAELDPQRDVRELLLEARRRDGRPFASDVNTQNLDINSFDDRELFRNYFAIIKDIKRKEFLREPLPEDIQYREQLGQEFPNQLATLFPNGSCLEFHGAPIFLAKDIILSGQLSSGADRFDQATSTNESGVISTTDVKTISGTIGGGENNKRGFIGIKDQAVPIGLTFVVDMRHNASSNPNFAGNVNLHNQDFYGVLVSPDQVEQVKLWLESQGLDPNKAIEYNDFLRMMADPELNQELTNAPRMTPKETGGIKISL